MTIAEFNPAGPAAASVEGGEPSSLKRKLKVAINPHLIDKNASGDKRLYADGWRNFELSAVELADVAGEGGAYCAQLTGARKAANFLASDVVSVDMDGARTVEAALADPIVQRHATFLYTTCSHTPEQHRFRIVFALPRTITAGREMAAATRSLALRLQGDLAATDATRICFGSSNAQVWMLGHEISAPLLEELIAQGIHPPQSDTADSTMAIASARSALPVQPDQPITLADGTAVPFSELRAPSRLYCPFHADRNPSAFTVTSKQGTVGIHCSACASTFWPPESANEVDFSAFERNVKQAAEYFKTHQDWGDLGRLMDLPKAIPGLTHSGIAIVSGTPAPPSLPDGVCFVKSPKGSGKTESLRALLSGTASVILIGHRRALIRQSCERLGLHCYLDEDGGPARRYGICLDSLLKVGPQHKYDVVVLDESEQLLAHFLSDTIEHSLGGGRDRLFVEFGRLVASAKHVVALDADLGYVTAETIAKLRSIGGRRRTKAGKKKKPAQASEHMPQVHIWINDVQSGAGRNIQIYESEPQLTAEMMQAVADGKRCFVTSNSKARIKKIHEVLRNEFGKDAKLIAVTADTVNQEGVKALIADVKIKALEYQVILTSPSLGTGVDITFPDEAKLVDVVFGFFGPKVNTHFDCDQQLARVRHPGEVKVWLTGVRFHFETNREVIKQDIIRQSLFKNLLVRYTPEGEPIYRNDPDPFIEMAALIKSEQIASKNNLKKHFIAHKKSQGWEVMHAEPDEGLTSAGKELLQLGAALDEARLIERLTKAPPLRWAEFSEIKERMESDGIATEAERWSLERTMIELHYRQKIDADVILLDDLSRYRGCVQRFRFITNPELLNSAVAAREIKYRYRFVKTSSETALAILRLLDRTPLFNEGRFDEEVVIDRADLSEFVQFAKENKSAVENLLELEVRRDVEQKPIQQLNGVLKLVGLRVIKVGAIKRAGEKIYRYRLDPEALAQIRQVIGARAKSGAWESVQHLHGWPNEEPGNEEVQV
jgi:hypothetical protein